MADHVADPSWTSLVRRLEAESPLFGKLWNKRDVTAEPVRAKRYQHPEAGPLSFTVEHLHAGRHAEIIVSTYTPADDQTATKVTLAPGLGLTGFSALADERLTVGRRVPIG
jgi:hypothetical protein